MEQWKQIKDFPRYEVSTYGRIRVNGKKVKEWHCNNKYITTRISNDKESKLKTVHQLVIETFIDKPDPSLEVNHKDCNKSNNCLDNLEYVSRADNMKHALKSGRMNHIYRKGYDHHAFGKPHSPEIISKMRASHNKNGKHPNYVLTDLQIYDIKKRHFEGIIMPDLAKEFKTSVQNISLICAGKRRANIAPEYNKVKRIPKRKAKRKGNII
jgi:hypothetical protein